MKVRELIKELEKCDQDAHIIVQEYNGADDIGRVAKKIKPMDSGDAYLSDHSRKIVKNSPTVLITAIKF